MFAHNFVCKVTKAFGKVLFLFMNSAASDDKHNHSHFSHPSKNEASFSNSQNFGVCVSLKVMAQSDLNPNPYLHKSAH